MNWEEYKQLSEKTLSTEFHCSNKDELILHAVMGVLTELEELLDNHLYEKDDTNVLEEVGDVTWYLAILGRELDIDYNLFKMKYFPTQMETVIDTTKLSLKLLDIMKKKLYYNKPIDFDKFIEITEKIILNINGYAHLNNINIEKCFDVNISKLKARYGDKFTSERAINRDLNTERKILEDNNE